MLVVAFVGVPLFASDYLFRAILIPFLILSLAAIGLNILVGYCGQISLGTGAFMAVGAYAAYNFVAAHSRPELPDRRCSCSGGCARWLVGILFGIPSLRIKGLYLAVATLAAQFFFDWVFARVKWFTNYSPSGSVSRPTLAAVRLSVDHRRSRSTCSCLTLVTVFALLAKNLVRGAHRPRRGWRSATWTSPPR